MPKEHLAGESVTRLGHFVKAVMDQVDVSVIPFEMQTIRPVPGIGVGAGKPSEGFPFFLSKGFGN